MPRYFFDLYNDITALDDEGRELPDLESAKNNASKEAREMVEASVHDHGRVDLRHRIELRNDAGAVVHTVHFEDAVNVVRAGQPV